MKGLVEDGRYRFALSGSLLGVTLGGISSWPSGYMSQFTMYPMDFEEFCWANNVNSNYLKIARESFMKNDVVDEYVHKQLMDLFNAYILVGGMPASVKTFVDTHDWYSVEQTQKDIEAFNVKDVTKYAAMNEKLAIKTMYEQIPEQIQSKNKRFQVGLLKMKNKPDEVRGTFLWLENANLAIPVWNVTEPLAPLRTSLERNLCKLFHEDTGLLTLYLMDPALKEKVLLQKKNVNYGGIYENIVAILLKTHGFNNIFYYNSKKYGEVDFLIEKNGEVIPIEVKSGKDYRRHQALDNLSKVYQIDKSIVLHNGNYEKIGNVSYFPIYFAEFITKKGEDLLDW